MPVLEYFSSSTKAVTCFFKEIRWSFIFSLYFFYASLSFLIEFLPFFESQLTECNLHLMIFQIVQLKESLGAFYCEMVRIRMYISQASSVIRMQLN